MNIVVKGVLVLFELCLLCYVLMCATFERFMI